MRLVLLTFSAHLPKGDSASGPPHFWIDVVAARNCVDQGLTGKVMTFFCTAPLRGPWPEPVEEAGGYVIAIGLGSDDELGLDYTLLIGLEPLPGGEHEFFFFLVEVDVNTGKENPIWSGQETARKMSKYQRGLIRACLLTATENLIRSVRPPAFSMTTHDENLPERPLEKFTLLTNLFERCGYSVTERDRRLRNRSWRMEQVYI